MTTCRVCHGEYGPGDECLRCGSQVDLDETSYDLSSFFSGSAVFLSAFASIVIAVMILWIIFPTNATDEPEKLFSPLFLVLSLSGVVLMPFALHQQLWAFWERQWLSEIYDIGHVPISYLMVDLLGIILFAILGSYALFISWGNVGLDKNIVWWRKMIFGGTQMILYVSLSTVVSLYRLNGWLRDLRRHMPHPLYADMPKLKKVVCAEVLKMLEFVDKQGNVLTPGSTNNYAVTLVVKQAANLQFHMTFGLVNSQGRGLARPEDIVHREKKRQWEVETDRWGRIKVLQPKNVIHVVRAS